MVKLLSLPPHLVEIFYDITGADAEQWFCASDPKDKRVGSGGGTVSLIDSWREARPDDADRRMIIVHACGESRRLPAYAPLGKVLTPIPVFRWASGQTIDQTLLSLQMPLYEEIMAKAPAKSRALIASGDVFVRIPDGVGEMPDADVVCFGIWANAELASRHGVFVVGRNNPTALTSMLQKPSVDELSAVTADNYFLMDIGVWLLSDKALDLLRRRSMRSGELGYYDLYTDFGRALGSSPVVDDVEINQLSVAIIPMQNGEFYHFGTSAELLSSTLALQSKVSDQRFILHNKIKPNSALFTQNSLVNYTFGNANSNIWIENSEVGTKWSLASNNIVTGVPDNDWTVRLDTGVCLDLVAVGEKGFAVRPYGFNDMMRGALSDEKTTWINRPAAEWFAARNVAVEDTDIHEAKIFPVVEDGALLERMVRWMVGNELDDEAMRTLWLESERLSANDLLHRANLQRITDMRRARLNINMQQMAEHHASSVFYQLDLKDIAEKIKTQGLEVPELLTSDASPMKCARNSMLRYVVTGNKDDERRALEGLSNIILSGIDSASATPKLNAQADQIIWSRSPLRIDLAGGWSDTPPYSLNHGAAVVNMAVNLNGQQPLQAFIKPCAEPHVVIRSIDMGAEEVITAYDQLLDFHHVGSPFSIPKAALALAGFAPQFSPVSYSSLRSQLENFGSGIELTLLSAVPAGSGMGTSSILASTLLAAISDFAGLAWSKTEICRRTLALEQLLTTGGGWQDQYGGVLSGVKLLTTGVGVEQNPTVQWLPEAMFRNPETACCQLLYYTGMTRVAKNILSEIVRGMFLNSGDELRLLEKMKRHAHEMADAIQRGQFEQFGRLVGRTWSQNQKLDAGTNPPQVKAIIDRVADLCLGLKLPGAGGGGFLYMVAKDPEAAAMIRERLTSCPPNPRARFVDMSLSDTGLQVSRS